MILRDICIHTYISIYKFPIEKLEDFCCFNHQRFQAAAQRSHEQQMAALNAAKRVLSDARLEEILWWKKTYVVALSSEIEKGGTKGCLGFVGDLDQYMSMFI